MRKVASLLLLVCASCADGPPGPLATPPLHTPRWAFRPWISKDISTTDDSYTFVDGFLGRQIPVGVLVLDSPWPTDYNTFVPNPVRYHDFDKLVADLKQRDVRMVLWTTQMLNALSYDAEPGGDVYTAVNRAYEEARDRKLLVDDGALYDWWKGSGAGIDFFNAEARAFWHELQRPLLERGVCGWKLDFGEQYIRNDTIKTAQGIVSHQAYSEEYYRDFFAYGVAERGDELVTMVRPYDESYEFAGRFYARPEHAPVTWVGDNRRDWIGLADALDHIFRSARAGYVVIGSDIGGYLDRNDDNLLELVPFDAEVFLRWLALGALTPFMQLHGRANLEPWALPTRSDEAVEAYRYWATLHEAMVPYFHSLAEEAYAKRRGPIIEPVGDEASWPGDYRFTIGDALLVAPLLDGSGARDVQLPAGSSWIDWWDGSTAGGGMTVRRDYAGDGRKIPLFVRQGSIIPLDGWPEGRGLDPAQAGVLGLPPSGGALVLLVTPFPAEHRFTLHQADGTVELSVIAEPTGTHVKASRATRPLLVGLRRGAPPASVKVNGAPLTALAALEAVSSAPGWYHDPAASHVWIRVAADPAGVDVTIE
jgi:alpha-glucosidase (family GH31 glycosyl hydrolase)